MVLSDFLSRQNNEDSNPHEKAPTHSINNVDEGMAHTRPLIQDGPFYPGLTYRPPPKPIRSNMHRGQESSQSSYSPENISSHINLDFSRS